MRFKFLAVVALVIVSCGWAEPVPIREVPRETTAAISTGSVSAGALADSDSKNKPTKPVSLSQLYVIDGCDVCAGLLSYLTKAGVKLELKKVERSSCSAYPTVVYSDGVADHGERIYAQQVPLPKSVKVEDARSGS